MVQNRPGSVFVQKSFERISALDAFYEKDEREDRYIGEVLERYRGEDAGVIEEAVRQLIGILSRVSSFLIQYLEQPSVCGYPKVKESKWQSRMLTLLCDDLCESLVPLQRQHFAASHDLHEHPRGHSSWRESTRTNTQMEYSKM